MGTAPDAVKRLVDRIDQNRKVFLSGDYKEEQLPEAKTPHEQVSLQRQIAVTDEQIDVAAIRGLLDRVAVVATRPTIGSGPQGVA